MGLSGRLWPVHPHRIPDELLSCWFARTANDNRYKVHAFGSAIFGVRKFSILRDMDRCATDDFLTRMSEKTGVEVEDLKGGMLQSYEGKVFDRLNPSGPTNWVLPSNAYVNSRRRYGLQFCPLCLFFDKQPYYRVRWRLAFSTICDVHGTLLHDRCPKCEAPIIFYRNDVGDSPTYRRLDFTRCWTCGFDLRRAPAYSPPGPDGQALITLRNLISFAAELGWWNQGSQHIPYSTLYFFALHWLLSFLGRREGVPLLSEISRQSRRPVTVSHERRRCEFESKSIQERHELLVSVLWLLEEWPERYFRVARAARMTHSVLIDRGPFPYWFDAISRPQLMAFRYSLSREEVESAVRYLERRQIPVSGMALEKLLGRKDCAVARLYFKPCLDHRFNATEVKTILAWMEVACADYPVGSRAYWACMRDRMILRLMGELDVPFRKLRRLTTRTAGAYIDQVCASDQERAQQLKAELDCYIRDVRSAMAGPESGDALFLIWKKEP